MKAFVVAIWLLLSVPMASAIQVTSTGRNFQEAKQNAFVTAIELTVGSVVVSERESNKHRLTRNEILVYSSGYIENYKIISQTYDGIQVSLTVDVIVNTNKISDRILGRHTSTTQINNDIIQAQINTYRHEKAQADNLLDLILQDYPYKAYNVEQLPHYISTSSYRNIELVMPYKLSWNYDYVMALSSVVGKIQDAKPKLLGRNTSIMVVSIKSPKDFIIGERMQFEFNDLIFPQKIANNFYTNEVRIMGRVLDKNNQTVWYICHHPEFLSGRKPAFYASGDIKNLAIFGNNVERGEVRLAIGPDLNRILQQAYQIQLQIVKNKDC